MFRLAFQGLRGSNLKFPTYASKLQPSRQYQTPHHSLDKRLSALRNSIQHRTELRPKCNATRVLSTKTNPLDRPPSDGAKIETLFDKDIQGNEVRWKIQSSTKYKDIASVYSDLSKDKLTAFVVLTAMAGYAVAPGAAQIGTLLWTTMGTTLCSASANSFNQWIEVPYDAQMSRTRNRPLARYAISPLHALGFATTSGIAGVASLYLFVNPLTAALGAANIVLYAGVYTATKRITIANTWVGSLVGAIPPLMGWAAVTGTLDPGAWALGALMFAWQFPHFNSLAHTLRADYSKAGYRMMSVTKPRLNARVSLRYSILLFPISVAFSALGITDWWFVADSSVINGFMAWCAFNFWRNPSAKNSRKLFFSSLVHLPVLLILVMAHKFIQERKVAAKEKKSE